MFKIICVTCRALCGGDFTDRLEKIAAARPDGIILREKDLPEAEYLGLAAKAADICAGHGVELILHSFADAADKLGAKRLHMPLHTLSLMPREQRADLTELGASCHSADDAVRAQALGCTYVTAGHVFATDCKRGLAPRGLDFLGEVCRSVSIPVYAIGGISEGNIALCRARGAAGACVMSGFMRCADPSAYLKALREAANNPAT